MTSIHEEINQHEQALKELKQCLRDPADVLFDDETRRLWTLASREVTNAEAEIRAARTAGPSASEPDVADAVGHAAAAVQDADQHTARLSS
uniref:hypothetical protein n=1 Tax=Amycolatopsis sp. CA-096443 TaxID=3239919 RepID=UPI003F491DD5